MFLVFYTVNLCIRLVPHSFVFMTHLMDPWNACIYVCVCIYADSPREASLKNRMFSVPRNTIGFRVKDGAPGGYAFFLHAYH